MTTASWDTSCGPGHSVTGSQRDSGGSLTWSVRGSAASSVISSVIAVEKSENAREQRKEVEKIRRRYIADGASVNRKSPHSLGLREMRVETPLSHNAIEARQPVLGPRLVLDSILRALSRRAPAGTNLLTVVRPAISQRTHGSRLPAFADVRQRLA